MANLRPPPPGKVIPKSGPFRNQARYVVVLSGVQTGSKRNMSTAPIQNAGIGMTGRVTG